MTGARMGEGRACGCNNSREEQANCTDANITKQAHEQHVHTDAPPGMHFCKLNFRFLE